MLANRPASAEDAIEGPNAYTVTGRTIAAWRRSGTRMSSTYRPWPVRRRGSSLRRSEVPMGAVIALWQYRPRSGGHVT